MTNPQSQIDLNGHLRLNIKQHIVEIECAGKLVKVTFTSFQALVRFIYGYQSIHKLFSSTKRLAQQLDFTYYLESHLIGESNSRLSYSRLGAFFGMENSRIHLSQFVRYFFSLS